MSKTSDDPAATRRTLLGRLKNWDDQKSWKEFFDTYWKLIYGVARKSGLSDAEAQEVVQEVVIRVSRKIGDLKYDPALGSFRGWLLTMTRWRINDQFRKRRPERHVAPAAGTGTRRTSTVERMPDPAGIGLEAVWDKEWEQNLIDAALARVKRKVNPKQYQIFDCYVIQGWRAAKVAQALGVGVGEVYLAKHRVGRLLKQAAQRLEKELL